jgi:NAD-dependent dihydropyrimidine dehydrogenase PreA subunit/DNA-binding transcriptional ArsR family regulator
MSKLPGQIYNDFTGWLNKTWWGLPKSDELLPLIQARYTPEEADLLTGMPYSGRTLEELAKIKGMDPAELGLKLEDLVNKGLVYRRVKGDVVRYSLNDSFFVFLRSSFWHGREDEDTENIAPLINRYFHKGFFDQYADAHARGLRSLPIRETIENTKMIMPFEDVIAVLDERDYFAVSFCPCRHRKNIDPDSPDCPHPVEVCLHFDELGRYTVDSGLGREISLDDAREILRESAESGLVHGVSNWKEGVDTICNCCKCCCMWFESYHKLGHAKSLDASNYRARITVQTCKGCALCVKRCPMDALHLEKSSRAENKNGLAAVLDPDKCIGCGVCAYKCPTQSIHLERLDTITEPPNDPREYAMLFLADREKALKEREGKK